MLCVTCGLQSFGQGFALQIVCFSAHFPWFLCVVPWPKVGTPAYMSPELMRYKGVQLWIPPLLHRLMFAFSPFGRNERYDFHVDMWALGCICFEYKSGGFVDDFDSTWL